MSIKQNYIYIEFHVKQHGCRDGCTEIYAKLYSGYQFKIYAEHAGMVREPIQDNG